MTRLRLFFSIATSLATAAAIAPALADPQPSEVVATAQGATQPPPAAAPNSTTVAATPSALDDPLLESPLPDRKVRGEVTVGVGTNGYREVSGAVDGPLGKDGEVFIAIDVGRENAPRR